MTMMVVAMVMVMVTMVTIMVVVMMKVVMAVDMRVVMAVVVVVMVVTARPVLLGLVLHLLPRGGQVGFELLDLRAVAGLLW